MDNNCFEVSSKSDPADSIILCGCPFAVSSGDAAQSWISAILTFKNGCGD